MNKIESPEGFHYTFQQTINDVAVYDAIVKVNLDQHGTMYAMFDLSRSLPVKLSNAFPPNLTVINYLNEHQLDVVKVVHYKVYFPVNNELIPAISIEILTLDESYEVVLDEDGKEIYYRDLTKYHDQMGKDSIVSAAIFLPDPLTSANVVYGGSYQDFNDGNIAVLNAEMVNVSIPVDFENDTFHLEGPYVKITNYNNTSYTPAKSTTPFFHYNRSDQNFEDINVYYHIHVFQEYVQSLGYTNLANYQIHAETHAYAADNSTFVSSFNPPRLNFGEGGVDDGEDADVIVHEYGHAIQHSAAPGTFGGLQRKALDEGISDYLAASYSRSLNNYNWGNVFSWDGHNEFYGGRVVNSDKHYPEDLGVSYHFNGEIWSSALMEIWSAIGRELTDKLVLQSIYDFSNNMSMSQAAQLVIIADSNLNNGDHYTTICDIFDARGFSTICNNFTASIHENDNKLNNVQLINTDLFAIGQYATLQIDRPLEKGRLIVSDVMGRILFESNNIQSREIRIPSSNLQSGLYFITITAPDDQRSFKLIRN